MVRTFSERTIHLVLLRGPLYESSILVVSGCGLGPAVLCRVGFEYGEKKARKAVVSENDFSTILPFGGCCVVMAIVIVGLHFMRRHRWDAETARLKTRGLPWIVLLILTVPFIFCAVFLAGSPLGHEAGSAAVLIVLMIGIYNRRVSAAKKHGR